VLLQIYIYIYIPLETSFLAHPMVLSAGGFRHHVPGAELVELLGPIGPFGPLGPIGYPYVRLRLPQIARW